MFRAIVVSLAALALLVPNAQGITAGPGGKIYFLSAPQASTTMTLSALRIHTDWSTSLSDNTPLGTIADTSAKPNDYVRSPEIMVSGGMDGWATLGVGTNSAADTTVMQLLKVQTSSSGNTVTVLGAGRSSGTGNTSTRVYGFLDATGSFTGHANSFVVPNGGSAYALWDADSSGDISDCNTDYHQVGQSFSYPHFEEICGSYLFGFSSGYYSSPPGSNIAVTKNLGGGSYKTAFWYTKPSTDTNSRPYPFQGNAGFAADCVNVKGVGLCTAVYAPTQVDAFAGTKSGITMFVDINHNDNATDPGEQLNVVDLSGSLPVWLKSSELFSDIDVFRGSDGTRFMLLDGSADGPGATITVLKLCDNGLFSGDWAGDAKLICQSTGAYGGGYVSTVPHFLAAQFNGTFEFDATAAPEPATLLLLGSGLLGLSGYVRRRRTAKD